MSGRFSKLRIIAVEMLRGPDHMAMRTGAVLSVMRRLADRRVERISPQSRARVVAVKPAPR
ncbi:hypothetical protein GCM10007904_20020 [Oharaeibacter diazotrophicus]|nr:hypothetical protein GCM10007904_20020 [Oharaeibacter diazotrophicus]